jgi:5-formyltetrahydrofolate cyclo-ligase
MQAVEIGSMAEAKRKTAVGVLEPEPGTPAEASGIDLVLVPGLGFGPAGQRIGRGAGFYDRFLGNPRLRAVRCGLAFELQVVEGIPMSGHDAALDMLITETGISRFARPR